jgi:hypothetical protein
MRNGVVYELPMQEHLTTGLESSSLPTPSASQEPGWTVKPVDKHGNITTNPNERWYHPVTGRLMQKGVIQALNFGLTENLLRTPAVVDGGAGAISEKQARERGRMVKVADQMAQLAFENGLQVSESIKNSLLPTPAVGHIRNHDEPIENYLERRQDFIEGRTKGMPGASLGVAVRMEMLMTPVASEGTKAPAQQTSEVKGKTGQVWLSNQAKDMETNWGKFAPAIIRWESLTRPAPAPTKPDGKDSNHRLSAEFTEWMMGLPAGWVTAEDIGLKRNDQLKACGNGVVPQQAELALRILLQDTTFVVK